MNSTKGFSLIELLLVMFIIATLSAVLLFNFSTSNRTKVGRIQVANIIISDIRRAQSMALAGTRYQGNITCGYGVDYVDKNNYSIYAKAVPGSGSCSTVATRNYQPGIDYIVEAKKISNANFEIAGTFGDIFFEPPDPKTYISNQSLPNPASALITIQLVGQTSCSGGSCSTVQVSNSGEVDLK